MVDREKVIRGLECCLKESDHLYSNPCNGCPYEGQELVICITRMKADALALLKEQEAEIIMEEKEKVIKCFEKCISGDCKSCDYYKRKNESSLLECHEKLMLDVLKILKNEFDI